MGKTVIRGYSEVPYYIDTSNSTWIVAKHAVLHAPAIAFNDGAGAHDNTYRIDGSVISNATWDPFRLHGVNTTVIVSKTGLVAGAGIGLDGANSSIENHGTIAGYSGYGATGVRGVGGTLDNFGQISGANYVRDSIVNHKGGVMESDGNAPMSLTSQAGEKGSVVNDGTVRFIDGGGYAISAEAGNDSVTNRGKLQGSVLLGGGNDHFTDTKGTIEGGLFGGEGNDTITLKHTRMTRDGNYVSDITGDAGNDTIKLVGAKVAEGIQLRGGTDHDTYVIDSAKYVIFEQVNEGFDKVQSSVSYTLTDNVEELILTGKKNINATGTDGANNLIGNSGNNTLRGKGSFDELDGKGGSDRLYGGDGADAFIFRTGYGKDSIEDFDQAEGDIVTLTGWKAITSFNDLLKNHASNHGQDVWIVAGNDRLIIHDIHKNELQSDHFQI